MFRCWIIFYLNYTVYEGTFDLSKSELSINENTALLSHYVTTNKSKTSTSRNCRGTLSSTTSSQEALIDIWIWYSEHMRPNARSWTGSSRRRELIYVLTGRITFTKRLQEKHCVHYVISTTIWLLGERRWTFCVKHAMYIYLKILLPF